MENIKNWTQSDADGNINVPDDLDSIVNKIGFQIRFMTLSGKNEIQTICDIAYITQQFYHKYYFEKWKLCDSGEFPEI